MTPATVCQRYRDAQALLPTQSRVSALALGCGAFVFIFIMWS